MGGSRKQRRQGQEGNPLPPPPHLQPPRQKKKGSSDLMLSKAIARHVRMTPRKVGYVLTPLRKRTVAEALAYLSAMNRRAAKPVATVIASAFANARQRNPELQEDRVIISKLVANEGPRWKRFRAAAFGRAARVLKRTTHIVVELEKS